MSVAHDDNYIKMTRKPVSRLILQLSGPTIVSMLIVSIYNLVDTFYVSALGTSASGAVGVVFGLQAIIQAFGFMFGHGAGSNLARKLGAQDKEAANVYASTGVSLAFAFGILLGITGFFFLKPMMYILGSTDTILPYACTFGAFVLLSAPFLTASFAMNCVLRYEGQPVLAMFGLAAGCIINVILAPVFMFGMDMGIAGVGLATAISQVISFLILSYMLVSGKSIARFSFKNIRLDRETVSNIISTGFPSLVRQSLNSISSIVLNNQAALYGDAAVAAMSIVTKTIAFVFAFAVGMGQGFQPVAAFNYGAGYFSRVKKAFNFTALSGSMLLTVFASFTFFFPEPVVAFFRDDPEVIEYGAFALKCQSFSCLFLSFQVVSGMLFQSIGLSLRSAFLSSLRNGLYFIPLIMIMPKMFGELGLQTAQSVADILAFLTSIPFVTYFFRHLPADTPSA